MITCKLTGQTGPAIKAHIVPESFYELPPQSDGPYKLVTNTPGKQLQRYAIGARPRFISHRKGTEK